MLIFPAVLFMTALFMRNLQPLQDEPARTAQEIVAWYAARPRLGLWLLLITLPLAVLTTGCAALVRNWRALATLTAAAVLAIVALHSLSD